MAGPSDGLLNPSSYVINSLFFRVKGRGDPSPNCNSKTLSKQFTAQYPDRTAHQAPLTEKTTILHISWWLKLDHSRPRHINDSSSIRHNINCLRRPCQSSLVQSTHFRIRASASVEPAHSSSVTATPFSVTRFSYLSRGTVTP
jgi:hypothetical protein